LARDYIQEAQDEKDQRDAFRRWIQVRADTVRSTVTVYEVLERNGVRLRRGDREEQIACPFHGQDRKPSARVYPETTRGPSHVWCFVCRERWDAIGLWKKFTGETVKFTRILGEMERAFGILPPERPPSEIDNGEDPELIELDLLFDTCERRLKGARDSFDMQGYLRVGLILDRLYLQTSDGTLSAAKAKEVLRRVLDKIGEKVRCHEG
jgi:hypothetical protein